MISAIASGYTRIANGNAGPINNAGCLSRAPPERGPKTTWKEYLRQHWDLIVAADFFTIGAWTDAVESGLSSYFKRLQPPRGTSDTPG